MCPWQKRLGSVNARKVSKEKQKRQSVSEVRTHRHITKNLPTNIRRTLDDFFLNFIFNSFIFLCQIHLSLLCRLL